MSDVRFTDEHEWIRLEGGTATVGITDYAQKQLGDLVFVEVPEVGRTLAAGDEAAVVESVKAASEVYSPASGSVTEVNDALADNPALVNQSPMGEGWFYKMRVDDPAELSKLKDEAAYKAYVEGLH
ncbi:MAG: glycine cleavage system protein H [Alphaproteobacteria bacterium RIFOXYD12_FULL_60_8]|nr:MAG: glycine cleavage system protein H [Alphaproteobacteria bacterium RIFOXYD12_FULL_60_8]